MSFGNPNPALSATVVICTRDRADELEGCLQSTSQLQYPDYSVLVVENGTPDGRTRALCQQYGARYLHSPLGGLSRARNDGATACTTDLVAYTDDDARPHKDWLSALAAEFCDAAVMAVAGLVLPRNTDTSPPSGSPGGDESPRVVVDQQTPDWFAQTNFGGVGIGTNMCFRRTAFEILPGFDERLGRGAPLDSAEEHLVFYQLVLRGYRCVRTPLAIVRHPQPADPDELRRIHYKNLSNAVAYAGLLWAEFPESRGPLLKHLWNRSFGPRSKARAARGTPMRSSREQLRAVVTGIRLYWSLPCACPRTALIAVPQAQKAC